MRSKVTERINERLVNDRVSLDIYYIVGTEIRARRYRLGMTLEALADGICSLSYLCKVENCKIQPNRQFLAELCDRLELTMDQVDTLLDLRDALVLCISDFLQGSSENIDLYFEKGKPFDNYRYSIIKFIYYLYHHDLPNANKVYLDLIQISQTMREFDFVIFSLFSAYLHYYNFRFNEALEILENINKFSLDDNLEALKYICHFKASFGANKQDTPVHYLNAKNILVDKGPYYLLDEMRYIICLYYIKNGNYYLAAKEINGIRNEIYKNSLELIKCFKDKNVSKILNYKDEALTKFALMLKLYVVDFDKFLSLLDDYDNEYYIYDFDYNYLDILGSKTKEKYATHLFNEIIPRVCISDDNFIKHVVLKEVAYLPSANKHRNMVRAYFLMFGYDKEPFEFDLDGEEE
ncbi:MAG: helix-turn-helix domain-containing protein [Acholeplasmatales bacterium]|nr:helix-turn-helix domain-containing protein [Acholeplasmatales bacterium]